jgi:hypothetical protein
MLENGQVTFKATGININGNEFDTSQATQFTGKTGLFGDVQTAVDSAAQGHRIQSLDLDDTSLVITWEREDPDAPALVIVNNTASLTVSEDYVNALPHITQPSDTRMSGVHIDFQPSQLIITATRQDADGSSQPITVTAVPMIYNGLATWSITGVVTGGTPYDAAQIGQLNDDIVGSWRTFFSGLYRSAMLANIALTDDSLTLTWDSDLNTGIAFQPGVNSLVLTEDYINGALQVRSPADYTISNVVVDLQPDQVVLYANLNLPGGKVVKEQAVFVPEISGGFVTWNVASATLDDVPLDPAIIERFNDATASWLGLGLWEDFSLYDIGWVTITDTEIKISGRQRY